MKVVINACYGGFNLSPEAEVAYLQRKGKQAFHYTNARTEDGHPNFDRYVRADINDVARGRIGVTFTFTRDMGDEFTKNEWPDGDSDDYVYLRDVERDDADLVAVVELLGPAASGSFANLKIIEIPDDVEWEIDEYDGMEHVAETHRVWR